MSVRHGVMKVIRHLERGHSWVGDDDGDEFRCENCGRTIWLPTRLDGELATLRQAVLTLLDCDMEKVRQVMES